MLAAIPLLILPFAIYNLAMIGMLGGLAGLNADMVSLSMLSGATWTMRFGDLLIVGALLLLFVELLKATRTSSRALMDHLLSMILFIVFLIEFLLLAPAAAPALLHPDDHQLHRCYRRLCRIDALGRPGRVDRPLGPDGSGRRRPDFRDLCSGEVKAGTAFLPGGPA